MKRSVRAERELAANPDAVMDLLLDPAGYSDWLPGVSRARLLVQEGDIAALELDAFGYAAHPVSFELVRTAPLALMFQQTGQLGERGLSGTVMLEASGALTRLEVQVKLHTAMHHLGTRRRLHDALGQCLSALEDRLQHGSGAPGGRTRRLILQVRRLEHGLEIWYQGRVFTTAPESGETQA